MQEEQKSIENELISNFQAITENTDPAIAVQYLTANNFDLSVF